MDTIFVKSVRSRSPAQQAGLATGDRLLAVNGRSVFGHSYQRVVQWIQQSGTFLHLLVVPKEDDILQLYFGDAAHHPETNPRPYSGSGVAATAPAPRLSCSPEALERRLLAAMLQQQQQQQQRERDGEGPWAASVAPAPPPNATAAASDSAAGRTAAALASWHQHSLQQQNASAAAAASRSARRNSEGAGRRGDVYSLSSSSVSAAAAAGSAERALWGAASAFRPLAAAPNAPSASSSASSHSPSPSPSPGRRDGPDARVHAPPLAAAGASRSLQAFFYPNAAAGCRLSLDAACAAAAARRESTVSLPSASQPPPLSLAAPLDSSLDSSLDKDSKDSLLSIDSSSCGMGGSGGSASTLTGHDGGCSSEDSLIISRIRKSFEQKEEFLRRPNRPIAWSLPEQSSPTPPPAGHGGSAVIAREFYARPQKLQRPMWPPTSPSPSSSSSSSQPPPPPAPTSASGVSPAHSPLRHHSSSSSAPKPSHQSLRRVKSDIDSERDVLAGGGGGGGGGGGPRAAGLFERAASEPCEDFHRRGQFICGGAVTNVPPPAIGKAAISASYGHSLDSAQFRPITPVPASLSPRGGGGGGGGGGGSSGKAGAFVSTLSRIHENVAAAPGPVSHRTSPAPAGDAFADHVYETVGEALASPPDDLRLAAQTTRYPSLQMVQRRARQFETGSLDEGSDTDRTSLYRSELSRLSAKQSAPNVAVRRREFESKATTTGGSGSTREGRRPARESRSLESADPPISARDEAPVKLRARSNSAESWAAAGRLGRGADRSPVGEPQRHKAVRQDSYLTAVRNPLGSTVPGSTSVPMTHSSDSQVSPGSTTVLRRQKNQQSPLAEEERLGRRVSYLKATWGDRMHVDSDLELSDGESPLVQHRSSAVGGDRSDGVSVEGEPRRPSSAPAPVHDDVSIIDGPASLDFPVPPREGWLHCKMTLVDGKRAADRSWKLVWASLRGSTLSLQRERREGQPHGATATDQTPLAGGGGTNTGSSAGSGSSEVCGDLDTRGCAVEVAGDYTKKKHVLRLATLSGSEVLLQAETHDDMALWLGTLHRAASAPTPAADAPAEGSRQGSGDLPPTPLSAPSSTGGSRLSPLPAHKGIGIRKLTSFRNRSPTGQSPVNKTRKPSQTDQIPSPKSKTWKGRVAKQFRKIQHGAGSPSSPTAPHPEGCTIGVPLELCPPSNFSNYVPLLVELCTSVVDSRGLDIIGIYRVPGNTAAVSSLTETVNKGFEAGSLQDPRWNDVNVISSLLKLFFRKLPNALLTSELYPLFIEADKIEDPNERIVTIRKLVRELPEHHFETLRYLLFHLKKVVEHCDTNKMEARNLAIVFGPTLVRTSDDNMVTMVTDMSHQCRIVESLISHVDWFFSDDEDAPCNFSFSSPQDAAELEASSTNHNLLLSNIQKVEGMKGDSSNRDISAKDIVSSIISAANRKMQKAKSKKGGSLATSSTQEDAHDTSVEPISSSNKQTADADTQGKLGEREQTPEVTNVEVLPPSQPAMAPVATAESDESLHQILPSLTSTHRDSLLKSLHSEQRQGEELKGDDSSSSDTAPGGIPSVRRYIAGVPLAGDEAATIRTYTGLSATTQERIRKFELETKAMLQRDQRHRQEQERREAEKRWIEQELQQAKRDMENEDLLDKLADNPADISRRGDVSVHVAPQHRPAPGSAQLLVSSHSVQGTGPPSPAAALLTRTLQHYRQQHSNPEPPLNCESQRISDESDGSQGVQSSFTHTRKVGNTHFFPSSPTPKTSQPTSVSSMAVVSNLVDAGYPPTAKSVARSVELAATRSAQSGNRSSLPASTQLPSSASTQPSEEHSSSLSGEGSMNGVPLSSTLKRLKTSNEQGPMPSQTFSSLRSGSLDSLQEAYTSDSATRPQSDVSEDGGDLLASLTSTFDRKLKSLLTSSPSAAEAASTGDAALDTEPLLRHEVPPAREPVTRAATAPPPRTPSPPPPPPPPSAASPVAGPSAPPPVPAAAVAADPPEASPPEAPSPSTSAVEQAAKDPEAETSTSGGGGGAKRSPSTRPASAPTTGPRRMAPLERQSRVEQHLDAIDNKLKELQNRKCEDREEAKKPKDAPPKNEKAKEQQSVEEKETASTKLRRSESLSKAERLETPPSATRLKRSESLNKADKASSATTKLRRSESLTKAERSESPSSLKLKRSDSLTKTEKTESNNSKRKQDLLLLGASAGSRSAARASSNKEKENMAITKLKRKNGMPERSIKRRHTVGGTKDFDKLHWLDNRRQQQMEENEALAAAASPAAHKERQCLRTSSPDLSSSRLGSSLLGHERFLIEIRMLSRGGGVMSELRHNIRAEHAPSGMGRPHSLPDPNLASRVFKVPLESHV